MNLCSSLSGPPDRYQYYLNFIYLVTYGRTSMYCIIALVSYLQQRPGLWCRRERKVCFFSDSVAIDFRNLYMDVTYATRLSLWAFTGSI